MLECLICREEWSSVNPPFYCKHIFCDRCAFEYLKLRIIENKVNPIPCPYYNCRYLLNEDEIQKVVGTELFDKYKLFNRNTELVKNPNLRFCPQIDCKGYDIGSSKKHKLLCNECSLEYCYYCNEKWHINKTCKNSQEIKFDQWSLNHNVKYCPNCRRRIEKAGGCPSMECPICKAHWCWYCGKDLANGHDPILCVFIQDSWELRYWFIFFLLFGPITVPFGLGMFIIHLGQNYLTDSDKESKFISIIIKWKYITYPLIILLSPLLTIVLLLSSGLFIVYINRSAFKPYSSGCYRRTFKSKYARYILMFILSCIISVVLTSISLIAICLTPLIGILFLIGKLYSDINERKIFKDEKSLGYIDI
ncbi:hypothetical protein SteCoe_22570 [Stentor coeruleus]|uniref:RBR-type E3 ubiquitin transferase n=1 Tax=Stentor coeruleus TaxID=5963 RepID=A0A1R2BLV7_9CILI|nr:hypothetical protein SteCoe_22570 [Stentor coeruleus]